MARSLRDIRRKIKAIKSTKQVTKAMELVAASKMRRAVERTQALRRYADTAWELLQSISTGRTMAHPFLAPQPVSKVLAIVFTSDRGLCGSLNAQLLRALQRYLAGLSALPNFTSIDFVTVGRKGHQFIRRQDKTVIATFPALSNHPKFRDVLPIARLAIDSFSAGTYDHVVLLYTDFFSPLVQEPAVKVLLPFSQNEMRSMIGENITRKMQRKNAAEPNATDEDGHLFEPSAEEILRTVIPQLTEVQVYQAVLESVASEHSARMVAMRNATDNATDIMDDLTLTYNQTRQANITAELAELSAAAAVLG